MYEHEKRRRQTIATKERQIDIMSKVKWAIEEGKRNRKRKRGKSKERGYRKKRRNKRERMTEIGIEREERRDRIRKDREKD